MRLLLRYVLFTILSLLLPALVMMPNAADPNGLLDVTVRILMLAIYGCLAVFLMTGFRPAQMRIALEQTPTRIDDLHLWLAPVLVVLGFVWAGFFLIIILAMANIQDSHPFIFLGLAVGGPIFSVWMGIKVRRAFLHGSA